MYIHIHIYIYAYIHICIHIIYHVVHISDEASLDICNLLAGTGNNIIYGAGASARNSRICGLAGGKFEV
jgi:hypothetical protein